MSYINSQVPDVPELAHQGIFLALTAHRELLCQNCDEMSPLVKPYEFYENTVRITGS